MARGESRTDEPGPYFGAQFDPRGMIIGTVLVDRSKAKNTQEIIEAARQKAASVEETLSCGRTPWNAAGGDADAGRGALAE